jgi:hypothetical protein
VNDFSGGQDHITWMNGQAFDLFRNEYGVNFESFTCPNRSDFILNNGNTTRTGYYLIFGRDWRGWRRPTFISPNTDLDDPRLPGIADVIERGTLNPYVSSSSSHGDYGKVLVPGNIDPVTIGSAGGNAGYMDGSVQWVPQIEMQNPHGVVKNSTGILGWWRDPPDIQQMIQDAL